MAESSKVDIQVRTLDGESITVSISSDCSIKDLKSLLRESFVPAKHSPDFHLFCKGAKTNLGSPINSYSMGENEFMVLVPFTKKKRIATSAELSEKGEATQRSDGGVSSSFAASAWSDIMQDLSCLSDEPSKSLNGVASEVGSIDVGMKEGSFMRGESSNACRSSASLAASLEKPGVTRVFTSHSNSLPSESGPNLCPDNANSDETGIAGGEKSSIGRPSSAKRKGRSSDSERDGHNYDLLRDILCSEYEDFLSEKNCGRIHLVLESAKCLPDARTAKCLLFQELYGNSSPDSNRKPCICPSWLKATLKTFTFLNIFYCFMQMHFEDITWNRLKGAIERLSSYGVKEVSVADVEQLSLLCPNVVVVGNRECMTSKQCDAIAIGDPTGFEDERQSTNCSRTVGRQVFSQAIITAIRKRERAFKTGLRNPIKSFMRKTMTGSGIDVLFSLKNLLLSMKTSNHDSVREVNHSRTITKSNLARPRCKDTSSLLPVEMVEHLRRGIGSMGQIVHVEEIEARKAVYADVPYDFLEKTKAAVEGIGISRLYSHQAEAVQASLSGKNVVVATSTSSGKSLCYNLPVLEALSQDPLSCALYLFPTKALAQDQLRALLGMTEGLGFKLNIGVYDGDTPQEDRRWLRDNARLLITNPDMLHVSVLPYHGQFHRILSNLRFVIIDEAHAYKGAFGCHTALITRRLRRICCHVYGRDPSFIFSTATSANPREHAMELANVQTAELIENDGSPCGPKTFLLWNPPPCLKTFPSSMTGSKSAYEGVARRSSPILEVSFIFAEFIQHGLRCIAFCKTRKLSELVLCYTREILQETAPHLVNSICAYRGGYTAQDRRRIEADFFGGIFRGVAATNALELGIDVGHIDATLHLGFPGSVASLWQQAGRAGRRERPSLAVYVAFGGPLDQYFMRFPEKLFRRPVEGCLVDSHNQQALEQHLGCAALEHPLSLEYDEKYFGSGLERAIKFLEKKGQISSNPSHLSSANIWSYIGHERSPSQAINIRAMEDGKYKVIDKSKGDVIEEIEERKAFFQVYEGAVYMNQGKTYLVKVLDLSSKIAYCLEADLKYFTKTRDYTDIHVVGGDLAYTANMPQFQRLKTTAQTHPCKVTTCWFGFYRIKRGSNQIIDSIELSLPKYSYESQAVWIRVPQSVKTAVEIQNFSFRAGLHAASHALLNITPLYIMCNPTDLCSECANPHETRNFPERILLYDEHPGGIGISAQVQLIFGELLAAALEIVTTCACSGDSGCPNCIQSLSCHEYNEVLDKSAAIMILEDVIEAEKLHFESSQ